MMTKDLTTNKKTTATTGLATIDQEQLRRALDRLIRLERPRLRRLWAYFKNPMRVCGAADPGPAGAGFPTDGRAFLHHAGNAPAGKR